MIQTDESDTSDLSVISAVSVQDSDFSPCSTESSCSTSATTVCNSFVYSEIASEISQLKQDIKFLRLANENLATISKPSCVHIIQIDLMPIFYIMFFAFILYLLEYVNV